MATIDQRVVQMQFDNKQFEQGVGTSIKSLSDLRTALGKDFSTALGGLADTVGGIGDRFSTMGMIAITALQNITNRAIDAGMALAKSFTVQPLIAGFQEYEQKLNSVQTILTNTASKGTTINQVTAALNELNLYADKTIYNFAEMTRNIGTFTAAGVELDMAVSAIQGIANLAAASGSNAHQASTAMYQLSQALSTGTVKLMDWNSVVNAGMGGELFQNALKETARETGVAVDAMVENAGSFRNSLQEGWLSADILNTTLKKFTVEGAKDYADSMVASGKYTQEQADALMKQATMMEDAATKVKTFTQLMDTLHESAQSGWAQTWEMIMGDFEEAKSLFTEMNDVLGKIISDSAEARNQVVSQGLTSGWEQFLQKGVADEAGYIEHVKTIAKERGIAIDDMIEQEGSFEATLKSGWLSADIMTQAVKTMSIEMSGMSEEERKAAGYTDEHIKSIAGLNLQMSLNSGYAEEMAEGLLKVSGRENLIQALRNSFEGLMQVLTPINEAFRNIFPPMTGEQLYALTERIKEITEGFKLTETQSNNLRTTFQGLFAVVDMVREALVGVFGGLRDMLGAILPTGDGILSVTATIGEFLIGLRETTDITGYIKDSFSGVIAFLSNIRDTIKDLFTNLFPDGNPLKDFLDNILGSVKEFKGSSEGLSAFFDGIADILGRFWENVKRIGTPIVGFLKDLASNILDVFGRSLNFNNIVQLMNVGTLIALTPKIKEFFDAITGVLSGDTLGKMTGISSITGALDAVKSSLQAWQQSLQAKIIMQIAGAIAVLAASLVAISAIEPARLQGALEGITVLFIELIGALKLFEQGIGTGVSGMAKVGTGMVLMSVSILILAGALKTIADLNPAQLASGVTTVLGLFTELVGVAKLMATNTAGFTGSAIGLLLMSEAINNLITPIKELGAMDMTQLVQGMTALTVILAEMAAMMLAGNLGSLGISTGIGLIALATAINLIADAVGALGNMSAESLVKGLTSVLVILVEIAAFSHILGKSNLIAAGAGMILIGAALNVISSAISSIGSLSTDTIIKGLLGMAGALVTIAGAMHLMPKDMLLTGAALVVVSAGLVVMGQALQTMGGMSWEEIGKSLVVLAGSLGILTAAVNLMSGALSGAAALIIVSGALAILTPTLILLGTMSWESIGKGLVALAGALTIIGVAGALITPALPGLIGLGTAMVLLGAGVAAFGIGMAGIGVGITTLVSGIMMLGSITAAQAAAITQSLAIIITTIADLIPTVAKRIGEGIVEIAKAIGNGAESVGTAALQIVNALVKVLVEAIPTIVDAGIKLLISLLEALASYMPQLIQAGSDILIAFLKGIADVLPDIIDAGVDVIIAFLQGIADASVKLADEGAKVVIKFINGMADAIDNNVPELVAAFQRLGKSIIDGLVTAIVGFASGPIDAIKSLFGGMIDTGAKTIDSNSPSKVFMKLGQTIPQGLVVGIEGEGDKAIYAIKTLSGEIVKMGAEELGVSSGESTKFMDFGKISVDSFITGLTSMQEPIKKAIADTFKGDDQVKANMEALTNDAFKTIEDRLSSYEEIAGDRFGKLNTEVGISVQEMIENLKFNQAAIGDWAEGIATLAERGLDKGLLEQLRAAGPASVGEVKALVAANDTELQQLATLYNNSGQAAMNALVTSLGTSKEAVRLEGQNIMAALSEAFTSDTSLTDAMNVLITNNMSALSNGIAAGGEDIKLKTAEAMNGAVIAIQETGPVLETESMIAGAYIGDGLAIGMDGSLPDIEAAAAKMAGTLGGTTGALGALSSGLVENSPSKASEQAGIWFGEGFVNGLILSNEGIELQAQNMATIAIEGINMFIKEFEDRKDEIYNVGVAFVKSLLDGMEKNKSQFPALAKQFAMDFIEEFRKYYGEAKEAGEGLVQAAIDGINSVGVEEFFEAGQRVTQGFIDGILSMVDEIEEAIDDLSRATVQELEKRLDMGSPSRVTFKIGEYFDQGFINGIKYFADGAEDASYNLGDSAIESLKTSFQHISDALSQDFNLSPTIRPIVDLSDVKEGSSRIDSIFTGSGFNMSLGLNRARSALGSFGGTVTSTGTNAPVIQQNFEQIINAPKSPNRIDMYRNTKNLFAMQKEAVSRR